MSSLPIRKKNKSISLLVNGEEAFEQIISNIQMAEELIYINMFIWRDDKIGNLLAAELLKVADKGIKVYISKDRLGEMFEKGEEKKQSFFHKETNLDLLVQTLLYDKFYPMKGKVKSIKQRRNVIVEKMLKHPNIIIDKDEVKEDHSKYYIFDNKKLIIGGINVEDKEIYEAVDSKRYYDYMVQVDNKDLVEKFIRRINKKENFQEDSVIEFVINSKNNGERTYEARDNIIKLLEEATRSVDIIMAYIGDREIRDKIIEVANKGILVKMVLPGKANIQEDLNKKVLKKIMVTTGNKVQVYLNANMIHAKLIRIDDSHFTLGSINLNKQAMDTLLELNILIKSDEQDLNMVLSKSIEDILNDSTRISHPEEIKFNPIRALIEQIV